MANLTKKEIERGQVKNIVSFGTEDNVFYKLTYTIDDADYRIKFKKNKVLKNSELNEEIYNILLNTDIIDEGEDTVSDVTVFDFSSLKGEPIKEPNNRGGESNPPTRT